MCLYLRWHLDCFLDLQLIDRISLLSLNSGLIVLQTETELDATKLLLSIVLALCHFVILIISQSDEVSAQD